MQREPRANNRAGRLLAAAAVLALATVLVVWLAPGGWNTAHPVRVTGGASASAYRAVTDAAEGAPAWLDPLLEVATDGVLVVLGLLLAWWCVAAFRRGDLAGVAGAVLAGLGTVGAYGVSEVLKVMVDEERPCRALHPEADLVAECPAVGDWSFPSNHATLSAGLAVGLVVLWPRLAALTLPLAVAGALLRVVVGVHYPHDVLAGAVLGTTVVAAVLLAALPDVRRVAARWGGGGRHALGRVSDDRGPAAHPRPDGDGPHGPDRTAHHHPGPADDPSVQRTMDDGGRYAAFPDGAGGDAVPGGLSAGHRARDHGGRAADDQGHGR